MDLYNFLPDQKRDDHPNFQPGDTIKVHSKIKEGDKERVQIFEGVVISRQGRKGPEANFTVRKISAANIGVERSFLFHSPQIEKITVTREGRVKKSKLYHLRNIKGSKMKIKQRGPHQKSHL